MMTVTKGDNYKRVYKALQFHYHSKSEHTINGVRFDLEMHVVCEETAESKAANPSQTRIYGVFTLFFNAATKNNKFFEMVDFSKRGTNLDVNM